MKEVERERERENDDTLASVCRRKRRRRRRRRKGRKRDRQICEWTCVFARSRPFRTSVCHTIFTSVHGVPICSFRYPFVRKFKRPANRTRPITLESRYQRARWIIDSARAAGRSMRDDIVSIVSSVVPTSLTCWDPSSPSYLCLYLLFLIQSLPRLFLSL